MEYKILGLTDYAERYLSGDDYDDVLSMVGENCCDCDEDDEMVNMPDGDTCHKDFLNLEPI
jgi:hypothetical protein